MKAPQGPQYSITPPVQLAGRPRDSRGFIVPFFVAWIEGGKPVKPGTGTPDFRIVDPIAFDTCVRHKRCWLCGQPLGKYRAFVLGPMCVITRTNSEPPSHRACAEYAMRVCPFLSKPAMRRNPVPMPARSVPAPGEHSEANPGIMALWMTNGGKLFSADRGRAGILFQVNDPSEVVWWREGRLATRAEVEEGYARAMPTLLAQALAQGKDALREIERCRQRALSYIPAEASMTCPQKQ